MRLRRRRAGKRLHTVSPREAKRLLARHGFRVERMEGYAYFYYRGRGAARLRRWIERGLRKVRPLTPFASSFIVIARPAAGTDR